MKRLNSYKLFAILLAFIFWAGYCSVGLQKFSAHIPRGDITAYAQGLWNTLHGNPFASTFNYSVHDFWSGHHRIITPENSNIFGIHFNGILLAILPLYRLWPYPQTLIVIQAAVIACSAYIIYLLACHLTGKKLLALAIELSYLLNYSLITAALSEFHAYPLTVFFSALMLYYHYIDRRIGYYFSLLCLLMVQENASIATFFIGIWLALDRPHRLRGIITSLFGLGSLLVTTKLLIPYFSPMHTFLFESGYGVQLGSTYQQMLVNAMRHPGLLFTTFVNRDNLYFLTKLWLPILPLSLMSPIVLVLGSLSLLPNLMSSATILKGMTMHYEAVAIPFLYLALILGARFLITRMRTHYLYTVLILLIIIPSLIQYRLFTNKVFSLRCAWNCHLYTPRDVEVDQMLPLIPENKSVSTQDYLTAHLSNREQLYLFPVYYQKVEYLPLSKGDEVWPLDPAKHLELLNELRASPNYSIIFESDHYILFKNLDLST